MQQAYIVTGSLSDGRTVALDEPLPQSTGKVRVIVEILPSNVNPDRVAFMENMWEEQRRRGHVPPTKEQVDAYIRSERDSWDF